jgi:serine/threonine-protein kinase
VGLAVLGLGGYVVYAQMHAVEPSPIAVAVPSANAVDVIVVPIGDAGAIRTPSANPQPATPTNIVPPVASNAAHPTWHLPSRAGTLDLVSMPSARVFERGRLVGVTPLSQFPMTPGSHTLRLAPENGRPARTITVTIRQGQTTALREVW